MVKTMSLEGSLLASASSPCSGCGLRNSVSWDSLEARALGADSKNVTNITLGYSIFPKVCTSHETHWDRYPASVDEHHQHVTAFQSAPQNVLKRRTRWNFVSIQKHREPERDNVSASVLA